VSVAETVSGVGEERIVCYSACNMECFGVFVGCAGCDLCVPRAGKSDQLWRLSLVTLEWTLECPLIEVAPVGSRPSPRWNHAMTSVGKDLWLHGGIRYSGEVDTCTTYAVWLLVLNRGTVCL
jgi:hypothetical protein